MQEGIDHQAKYFLGIAKQDFYKFWWIWEIAIIMVIRIYMLTMWKNSSMK